MATLFFFIAMVYNVIEEGKMSHNYGYNGNILQDMNEISNRFNSLGEAITARIDPPSPSSYDFRQEMENIKKCLEIKKKYNVENLYFYETSDNIYMCLTDEEKKLIQNNPLIYCEITDPYILESAFNNISQQFQLINTGITYYGIDDLKRDWLPLTLSGLEE